MLNKEILIVKEFQLRNANTQTCLAEKPTGENQYSQSENEQKHNNFQPCNLQI